MDQAKKNITEKPILKVQEIFKSFGHIQVLSGISLEVNCGQVLAIVGDNGAGKTTLIKILSGALTPDKGRIIFNSEEFSKMTPSVAIQKGISTVYQDLALVDSRDVACNVFLGREPLKGGFIVDKGKMVEQTRILLDSLQISVPRLENPVGCLSGGQRQAVAVARAIQQGGKVIIFDEPTAAMGVRESAKVLELIQMLGNQGFAVMVISHNLHQVFAISDRICVIRQGKLVGDFQTEETEPGEIVQYITGANLKNEKEFEQSTDCSRLCHTGS
ncbi:ATP-binding cassette domain-containing protein [Candidatus Contubernalis alkaliaceticus]|uniref:ATP-binding cassette domain-containing protein n=1 Tax=Candidatus Contubernalis alkaliaceticus TaxID=338645 RepID=UPI001F4BD517|nr:ATP-binding cassette domain-containing protein [Candidatus Contubernalis alkalaceticus]UNC90866.1 sugar ABC transporter ATP-binding protein [Candidatus Contubernalis alkalaceticus]